MVDQHQYPNPLLFAGANADENTKGKVKINVCNANMNGSPSSSKQKPNQKHPVHENAISCFKQPSTTVWLHIMWGSFADRFTARESAAPRFHASSGEHSSPHTSHDGHHLRFRRHLSTFEKSRRWIAFYCEFDHGKHYLCIWLKPINILQLRI